MLALTSLRPSPPHLLQQSKTRRSCGRSPPRCATDGEKPQSEVDREKSREALRRLDDQLQSLSRQDSRPRKRPLPSPLPPDPNLDRNLITSMGSEEMPEISTSYLAYSAVALVILTIFNNIIFNTIIKPSVDGTEQASKIVRVPLSDPTEQQVPESKTQT